MVEFNLRKGDISSLSTLIADSAKVLGKLGADRFEETSTEVVYFVYSVMYHTDMLRQAHHALLSLDREQRQRMKDSPDGMKYYAFLWTPDTLATLFEFDSLLVCVRSLFDRLLQALKTSVNMPVPSSMNDLRGSKAASLRSHPLMDYLLSEWSQWGERAKDYRDCLLHYWTIHEHPILDVDDERRLLVPDNPDVKSKLKFTYSKRVALVDYAQDIALRSMAMVVAMFERMLSDHISEEFGDQCEIVYWDVLPEVDSSMITADHQVDISPGLVQVTQTDSVRYLRFRRSVVRKSGQTTLTWDVPEELDPEHPHGNASLSDNLGYFTSTELPVALKKMLDEERRG